MMGSENILELDSSSDYTSLRIKTIYFKDIKMLNFMQLAFIWKNEPKIYKARNYTYH